MTVSYRPTAASDFMDIHVRYGAHSVRVYFLMAETPELRSAVPNGLTVHSGPLRRNIVKQVQLIVLCCTKLQVRLNQYCP